MDEKLFKDFVKSIDQMRKMHKGIIKPRRTWTINPVTKVKPSKKVYKRRTERKVVEE